MSVQPPHWRPKTRGECKTLPRPCPYVSCRYHLASDDNGAGASVDLDVLRNHAPSCALDLADAGPQPMDKIASVLHIWHTNAEEALRSAMAKISEDKPMREMWAEISARERVHSLWEAMASADAEDESVG